MAQRRGTTIKQSAISDVMSRLSELPEREKDPSATVRLAEIFRTKEYLAEIKTALKKGYSFDDLAGIFTERCGVAVSARQIKYHLTRAKNRSAKGKSGKKPEDSGASGNHVLPVSTTRKTAEEGVKETLIASDSRMKESSNVPGFAFEATAPTGTEGDADYEAFHLSNEPKGS
jgi:hypothetical protein